MRHWTLVCTTASLAHLAERDIGAEDVADAVCSRYGPAQVRTSGRGAQTRWFVVAPLADGALVTGVLREALPRDLRAEGAFVVPATGILEYPGEFRQTMRLCVSARLAAADERRSSRTWRQGKGGVV